MAQIARLSPTHHDIARWVLENPGPRLTQRCADHYGYTLAWVSTILHSKAFQAHLAELQDDANSVVVQDIPARLRGLADAALEKLGEQLDEAITDGPASRLDRDFVKETADMALKALGFGAKHTPERTLGDNPSTVIYADKVLIEQARERMISAGRAPALIEMSPVREASEL